MKRLSLVAVLLLHLAAAEGQELQIADVTFSQGGQRGSMIRVDLRNFALKVVSTLQTLQERQAPSDPTLAKFGTLLPYRRGFALTSGGLNHEDPLDPAGLLVADKLSLAPLASNKGTRDEVAGILCVSDQGKASILSIAEYKGHRSACAGAIQAGPIVILTRTPALAELPPAQLDSSRSARLVFCESQGTPDEVVFYYFPASNIAGVRQSLQDRCLSALNLAGSRQAAISIWQKDGRVSAVGNTGTPLPSMIAVVPR